MIIPGEAKIDLADVHAALAMIGTMLHRGELVIVDRDAAKASAEGEIDEWGHPIWSEPWGAIPEPMTKAELVAWVDASIRQVSAIMHYSPERN